MKKALDRWLLVNYAGYPYAPNSLMPDNGLANLAGALIAGNKEPLILDYCTVDTIRHLSTPELTGQLARAWDALRTSKGLSGALRQMGWLYRLQQCDRTRRKLQDRLVDRIAAEIVATIKAKRIDAVGFKLWNGDGFDGAVRLAAEVRKQCPGVAVFGGGPHVDVFLDSILRWYPSFDALVFGEGEETIGKLAEEGGDAKSYARIPNLIFRDTDGQVRITQSQLISDLDELPMPVYDPVVYPAMTGNRKIKIIVMDESRGCKNQCAFCIHPIKSNQQLRTKGIDRLMREVSDLEDRYRFRTFRFAGSCTPYRLLNEFAAEVLRRKKNLAYASFAHIRDSEEADFKAIRQSGCVAMFFGIESGSQRILDSIRKGVRADQIPKTIQRANHAGLFTVGSIIFPAPGDDRETEQETLSILKQCQCGACTVQPAIVIPGTDWYSQSERYGIEIKDRQKYIRIGISWKIKLLLPPIFWKPLPIIINGQTNQQMLRRTTQFGKKIAAMGIPIGISDDVVLMSHRAGMEVARFKDESMRAFFSGDADRIEELAEAINANS